jgi:DNA-binding CsgD family transcriptional regulator
MTRPTKEVSAARKTVLAALDWSAVRLDDVATALGVSVQSVCWYKRICGLSSKVPAVIALRNETAEKLFRAGITLDLIGSVFEISRERVRQIIEERGVDPAASRVVRKISHEKQVAAMRKALWNKRCAAIYGCGFEVARELNGDKNFSLAGSPARAYVEQRRNSVRRGIPWEMNFPEWKRVWDESGKWDSRGRGKNRYVMSRIGDSGSYRVGNVEIISAAQNSSDSYMVVSAAQRAEKRRRSFNADPTHMSPRVKQVCELHLQGLSVNEIALKLGIHKRNAWQYVDQVKRKLSLMVEQKAAA